MCLGTTRNCYYPDERSRIFVGNQQKGHFLDILQRKKGTEGRRGLLGDGGGCWGFIIQEKHIFRFP